MVDSHGYMRGQTRLYTIQLGSDAEVTIHVNRYRMDGKRQVWVGFSANAVPFTGKCDLNLPNVGVNWAVNHLRTWRERGLKIDVTTFGVPH